MTVRDRETGHVYDVTEARYKRTPHLWERVGPNPPKPRTTVAKKATAKKAASHAETPSPDVAPDETPAESGDKEE